MLVLCCAFTNPLIAIGLSSMGAFLIGKQVWIFGSVLLIVGLIMLVKEEVVVIHVSRIVAIINSVKQKKRGVI